MENWEAMAGGVFTQRKYKAFVQEVTQALRHKIKIGSEKDDECRKVSIEEIRAEPPAKSVYRTPSIGE